MTPAVKRAWLQALRSADPMMLGRHFPCFCWGEDGDWQLSPVGVLLDVACDGWWLRGRPCRILGEGGFAYRYSPDGRTIRPSGQVLREDFGLPAVLAVSILEMEDAGLSYEYVADWIEENL